MSDFLRAPATASVSAVLDVAHLDDIQSAPGTIRLGDGSVENLGQPACLPVSG